MGLKALVTVILMVDGERKEFPPGSDLPEINDHDTESLKAMSAIEDIAETEKVAKAAAATRKKLGREFDAAREAVKEAAASVADGVATEVTTEVASNQ